MRDKTLTILLLIGTVIMTAMLFVMHYQDKTIQQYKDYINSIDTTTYTKTDTVFETKTVTDTVPKYITKWKTKTDTLYQPNDSTPHIVELKGKTYENTVTDKQDTISYQAHISGYDLDNQDYPRLDSINFTLRHQITQTNTTTTQVIKVPQKQNKVYLAPQFTVGYDPFNKQWGAIVGLGVGVRIGK